jgi:hypothetical protein
MAQLYYLVSEGNIKLREMKLSRILAYGVAGIFAGLLIENRALIARQRIMKKSIRKKRDLLRSSEKKPVEKALNAIV